MRTESAGAAIEMERALQRLQKRIYPDIMALCASFTAYAQMYEQCKADQIDALAQYGALYTAVQASHCTPILSDDPLQERTGVVMPITQL